MKKFYLFVDTETGGLDPKENPVLELYAAVYDEFGERRDNFYATFDPYLPMNCKALAINNFFQRKGQPDNDAEVQNFIRWSSVVYQRYNPTLVGQNIKFDLDFIDSLMNFYGFQEWSKMWHHHSYDTCQMGFILREAGFITTDKLNLSSLAKAYGVENPSAHSAEADAETTATIFFKMIDQLKKMKALNDKPDSTQD
jgi:DNA polymerase-3 subunit alpha (Gram-positive type)